jgi:integrase
MSVKVREKRGKLYLDIYQGGVRKWEKLGLVLTKDKAQNKEIMRLAEICRSKRETQFLTSAWDISDPITGKMTLIKFMEDYSKTYKTKSKNVVDCCIKQLKKYDNAGIQLIHLTPKWIDGFQEFLKANENISLGTAAFYARILRSALNKAVANDVIRKNPANLVQKIKAPEPEMLFLQFSEVKALSEVTLDDPYGAEVRRAFLFSCYTGLRISDLETLTWAKINTNPWQIQKSQEKTQQSIYVPLHKDAQALINDNKKHSPDELVFNFSAHNRRTSYYYLEEWAIKADLNTTIGWHTARRTFATMALENGADLLTVAKLLGHTNLQNVTKYAIVTDRLRVDAINALPEIGV